MPHAFDDGIETQEEPADNDFGGHQLPERQLAHGQEPAGGGEESAVGDGLPADRSQVLADQNIEPGLSGLDIGMDQFIGLFH